MIRYRVREGRCFEIAGNECLERGDWTLVHGVVRGPSGAMIEHAWLSKGGEVYEGVLGLTVPEVDYLSLYAAVARQTYTAHEAASLALELGHWGPWP